MKIIEISIPHVLSLAMNPNDVPDEGFTIHQNVLEKFPFITRANLEQGEVEKGIAEGDVNVYFRIIKEVMCKS